MTKGERKRAGNTSSLQKYIKKQIGVDISKYRDDFTKRYDSKDVVTLYKAPSHVVQQIMTLSTKYGKMEFGVRELGSWGTQIFTGDELKQHIKTMDTLWGKGRW